MHPLQSPEWAAFRKKTGTKVIETKNFRLTIHKIPRLNLSIGYFPKGEMPDEKILSELREIGKRENCIFIQLEPNVVQNERDEQQLLNFGLKKAAHPLFTKYTFILDLTKSEDELLKGMHPKTRYNIKIAKKHNVEIVEDDSDRAFEEYLKLTKETTKRQKFYAHTENYHRLMWETLKGKIAHLFLARHKGKILAAWIVFAFDGILYYPYGSSSSEHRETMASNLLMWEVILWGKKQGLKKFDMWGAMGPNPDSNDPWFGFHRFKQGYGPKHIEFIGSYDLVIRPLWYELYKLADKIRWLLLRNVV
ncbi:MAG TPA: peptidoglycan bridge formation glycyltransferase FemA/FemB family protein [Patescibacteria group bacterium]|nr:peptidoglycan bridge formation glycyltransferase FemA/FemB family protein [Patescibacteria group bacterium]